MVSGCRQKNIHTDYTDYMVGGGGVKIHSHGLHGLHGWRGGAKKNSHGLHGYMVSGCRQKTFTRITRIIWLSFTIRMGCDNNGNNTENKANTTGPERPEWGVHCFTIMPLCHQFPNQV